MILFLGPPPALDPGVVARAFGQPPVSRTRPTEKAPGTQVFDQWAESLQVIDWDAEQPHVERGLENMWRQNGWNDEPDRFAQELARRVSKIPPWQPLERLRVVSDVSAERYGLSPAAKAQFNSMVTMEAGAFFMRHAVPIVSQTREFLQSRAQGKPISAAEVARWAKDGAPVLDDFHRSLDRMIDQFDSTLDPRQKAILERDRKSYLKRREAVEQSMKRWASGEWKASDWGMQDDPIQNGKGAGGVPAPSVERAAAADARPGGAPAPSAVIPTQWYDYDPETWQAYILNCQDRYGLDKGQRATADSILAETYQRAVNYRDRRRSALAGIPVSERATHIEFAPIRELFEELRLRIEALTTSSQRERAAQTPARPQRSKAQAQSP